MLTLVYYSTHGIEIQRHSLATQDPTLQVVQGIQGVSNVEEKVDLGQLLKANIWKGVEDPANTASSPVLTLKTG